MKRKLISPWLAAVALAFALGGCASNAKQESVGEFIDDSLITTKVKSALIEDREVSALKISVATDRGVVQLSGFVRDTHESWKAAQLARNVKGVKSVRNELVVK